MMATQEADKRRYRRYGAPEAVALTPFGACMVGDIGLGGMSFRCLYVQDLSREWVMDVLDTGGHHLQELVVEKVWEIRGARLECSSVYGFAVGARFKNLTVLQRRNLEALLERLPAGREAFAD